MRARTFDIWLGRHEDAESEAYRLRHGGKAGPATQPTDCPDRGINRHRKVNAENGTILFILVEFRHLDDLITQIVSRTRCQVHRTFYCPIVLRV